MNVFEDSVESMTAEISKKISPKELEVMLLVGSGEFNKRISAKLNISDKTTTTHRTRVYKKLGISAPAEVGVLMWRIKFNIPQIKEAIDLRIHASRRAACMLRFKKPHVLIDNVNNPMG